MLRRSRWLSLMRNCSRFSRLLRNMGSMMKSCSKNRDRLLISKKRCKRCKCCVRNRSCFKLISLRRNSCKLQSRRRRRCISSCSHRKRHLIHSCMIKSSIWLRRCEKLKVRSRQLNRTQMIRVWIYLTSGILLIRRQWDSLWMNLMKKQKKLMTHQIRTHLTKIHQRRILLKN